MRYILRPVDVEMAKFDEWLRQGLVVANIIEAVLDGLFLTPEQREHGRVLACQELLKAHEAGS